MRIPSYHQSDQRGRTRTQQTFPILALQVSSLALQVHTDSSLFREILPKVGVEVAACRHGNRDGLRHHVVVETGSEARIYHRKCGADLTLKTAGAPPPSLHALLREPGPASTAPPVPSTARGSRGQSNLRRRRRRLQRPRATVAVTQSRSTSQLPRLTTDRDAVTNRHSLRPDRH